MKSKKSKNKRAHFSEQLNTAHEENEKRSLNEVALREQLEAINNRIAEYEILISKLKSKEAELQKELEDQRQEPWSVASIVVGLDARY